MTNTSEASPTPPVARGAAGGLVESPLTLGVLAVGSLATSPQISALEPIWIWVPALTCLLAGALSYVFSGRVSQWMAMAVGAAVLMHVPVLNWLGPVAILGLAALYIGVSWKDRALLWSGSAALIAGWLLPTQPPRYSDYIFESVSMNWPVIQGVIGSAIFAITAAYVISRGCRSHMG